MHLLFSSALAINCTYGFYCYFVKIDAGMVIMIPHIYEVIV
jgi:hypothetical protein